MYHPPVKRKVFISYARKDREYLDRLRVHLKPLERARPIEVLADDGIKSGGKWQQTIQEMIETAEIAILLISADFFASEFIMKNELPFLLTAAEKKGTHIFPVIVGYSRFPREPSLNVFQAINEPSLPLAEMEEPMRERVYDQIAQAIEEKLFGRNDWKS